MKPLPCTQGSHIGAISIWQPSFPSRNKWQRTLTHTFEIMKCEWKHNCENRFSRYWGDGIFFLKEGLTKLLLLFAISITAKLYSNKNKPWWITKLLFAILVKPKLVTMAMGRSLKWHFRLLKLYPAYCKLSHAYAFSPKQNNICTSMYTTDQL